MTTNVCSLMVVLLGQAEELAACPRVVVDQSLQRPSTVVGPCSARRGTTYTMLGRDHDVDPLTAAAL